MTFKNWKFDFRQLREVVSVEKDMHPAKGTGVVDEWLVLWEGPVIELLQKDGFEDADDVVVFGDTVDVMGELKDNCLMVDMSNGRAV